MAETIYLDHAATTAAHEDVIAAMLPFMHNRFGNPSSVYELASDNKKAIEDAREQIAGSIGAQRQNIYFTSGGTESDNWALCGAVRANRDRGRHIITSGIEHHAVLHTCKHLESEGYEVTYLDVDEQGFIRLDQLKRAIRPDTVLISIMSANNEIGTIQPIKEIGEIAKKYNILFHTDAVQAFGQLPINVEEYGIDLLSASGHKIYGPKGIGLLYIREGVAIEPLMYGGAQERNRRAGTENVPGIIGLAKAVSLMEENREEKQMLITSMRDHLIDRVQREIPYARVNGSLKNRLAGNANFCFQFIEGESLVIMLDMEGICASAGSACSAGQKDASHVLLALGLPKEVARGSLRLTIGAENTMEEIDAVVDKMKKIIAKLREASKEYETITKDVC